MIGYASKNPFLCRTQQWRPETMQPVLGIWFCLSNDGLTNDSEQSATMKKISCVSFQDGGMG